MASKTFVEFSSALSQKDFETGAESADNVHGVVERVDLKAQSSGGRVTPHQSQSGGQWLQGIQAAEPVGQPYLVKVEPKAVADPLFVGQKTGSIRFPVSTNDLGPSQK